MRNIVGWEVISGQGSTTHFVDQSDPVRHGGSSSKLMEADK